MPLKLLFGLDVSAAQSRGEYPGARMACFNDFRMEPDPDGAIDVFGSTFVCGTRREAAVDGEGRRNPLKGIAPAGELLNLGGLSLGGLEDLVRGEGGGGGGINVPESG